jgi:hypothetical protein
VPTTSTLDQGIIFGRVAAAEDRDIEAMTLNQALGADLSSLVAEPPDELNAALIEVLEDVVATDFPARAQRQAELIARRLPDLVGLQEVWDISCVGEGCSHPSIADAFVDHLEVTLDALAALGVDYEAVATVRNQDSTTATLTSNENTILLGGVPFEIDGSPALLTSSDRM